MTTLNLVLKLDDNVMYAILASIVAVTAIIAAYAIFTFSDSPKQHDQSGETWHK